MFSSSENDILKKYYRDIYAAVDFTVKTISNDFSGFAEIYGIPEMQLVYLQETSCCRVQIRIKNFSERVLENPFRGWKGKFENKYGNCGIIYNDFHCEKEDDVYLFLRKLCDDFPHSTFAGNHFFAKWWGYKY